MTEQRFPEPTVGALIVNPKGEILLIKSHKWHNKYVIPGGHIELGEKMEEALKREVKEETGLNVYDPKPLHIQEFIFDKAFFKKKHFIFHNFAVRTRDLQVQLNEEAQSYVWVSPQEALKLPLEPYTRQTVKNYIKLYL